ncbi:MAG: N-6 DNA methylase, partial [Bacteroidia bacterium]
FITALKALFVQLNIPINYVANEPTTAQDILVKNYKNTEAFNLIHNVYVLGVVNDAVLSNQPQTNYSTAQLQQLTTAYNGLLVLGITLHPRPNGELPTRTQLADITRAFNREFTALPVTIVFGYSGHISLANSERIAYTQQWREGDKVGKITLLKDINTTSPHRAHKDILIELGKRKASDFNALYTYWQTVLNTKELNDKFYQELFKWYLWAKDNTVFPNDQNEELEKHSSESLIRFISRILFVWFMKEKKLISNQIFELNDIKTLLLNFDATAKENSYYKAILQNLFFATLNVPINERKWIDGKKKNKAQVGDPLIYRYEKEFANSEAVIENIFMKIPFLNGGLFDCLDDRGNNIFIDGFTKNEKKQPNFPNYLFFGKHNAIDLSHHFEENDAKEKKKWKSVAVLGIIELLNDYKFTIEENTPLEIDVALDPELLGKVFENLLASFNPETKANARKQTGSFYTPREIVNYMVDESLLAYLQNEFTNLTTFETLSNLAENQKKLIVQALFNCKILDPACGSGAYPMGVLHKMVQLMTILDPKNEHLKAIETQKIDQQLTIAHSISDTNTRTQNIAFLEKQKAVLQDTQYDYVRKLYIIENCIHGVDIQPIAIQISKLRFFISLLVEQNKDETKNNMGIEPLPNMDFKLVAANTLIAPPQEEKGIGFFADDNSFFEKFEQLAHDYFTLNTPQSKRAKKQEIEA